MGSSGTGALIKPTIPLTFRMRRYRSCLRARFAQHEPEEALHWILYRVPVVRSRTRAIEPAIIRRVCYLTKPADGEAGEMQVTLD